MKKRINISQYWQELTIKNKFRVAFGTLLIFLTLMAISAIGTLGYLQNKLVSTQTLSTEIQRLVNGMNINLYQARSLEKDFFLWYPAIGYSEAYQKYAQEAITHTKAVKTLSVELQDLITESDVSDAWHKNKNSLNLYILSAKRHALTVTKAEMLIGLLAADGTGLQDKLARISFSLADALHGAGTSDLTLLFRQMQLFEKEYMITRQRPFLQSAFNAAIPLKEAIKHAPALGTEHKTTLLTTLDKYLAAAEEIAALDVAIRSIFNGFELELNAITPITKQLFSLANQEIERVRTQIGKRNQFSILIIAVIGLVGIFLSSIIALILNQSITGNVIKLTAATRAFHAGNPKAQVHIESADELGELGKSFNEMVASIGTHVENMGQKVTERTSQLTTKNKQLIQEVTERKQAESLLLMERDNLKAIFEAMTDGIYIVNENHDISYVNPALIKEFGEYRERKCYEYFHDLAEPCSWCKNSEVFAGKTVRWEWTSERNGRTYDLIDTPIVNADNTLSKIEIFRDITEQNKMKEQLLLNEKLATIASLAAGVAHEINTPLSGILQALQLVEMGLSPDEESSRKKAAECAVDLVAVQDYFQKNELDFFMTGIRESAIKAGNIIKSLQDFSRPQDGSFSTANLQDIVEKSLLLALADYDMKKKYGIAKVQIIKEYASDCPSVICAAGEIEEVMLNLIKNSVLSMAEKKKAQKPCITIRTFTTANSAVIEVEDNGPGIPEDIKNKIFDPFFTTREVGTGTGLGLSVCHAIIVDKHKGEIRVESVPEQGAKFIIELPLMDL